MENKRTAAVDGGYEEAMFAVAQAAVVSEEVNGHVMMLAEEGAVVGVGVCGVHTGVGGGRRPRRRLLWR
jgi:hypothetical protein